MFLQYYDNLLSIIQFIDSGDTKLKYESNINIKWFKPVSESDRGYINTVSFFSGITMRKEKRELICNY